MSILYLNSSFLLVLSVQKHRNLNIDVNVGAVHIYQMIDIPYSHNFVY